MSDNELLYIFNNNKLILILLEEKRKEGEQLLSYITPKTKKKLVFILRVLTVL